MITNPLQNSLNETSENISELTKPPSSIPPITVQGVDFVALREDYLKSLGSENFLFKSSSKDFKILTKNSDLYRAVIKYLNEKKPNITLTNIVKIKLYVLL